MDQTRADRPLFVRLPDLDRHVPWVPLADRLPTPLEQIDDRLWVKRDDLTASAYGGNKVRKLELIVAQAKRRGGPIITAGATGSHFALATAIHAARHDVPVVVIRFPQPMNDHVRKMKEALDATGAEVVEVRDAKEFPLAQVRENWKPKHAGSLLVPTGGSSPFGTLGYVNAALEIVDQWPVGEQPPEEVVVAMSSSGTAVGLSLGLALAGWNDTAVIGVRVADAIVTNRFWIGQLRQRTARVLRSGGAPQVRSALHVDDRWLGKGYGAPTPEAAEAAAFATTHYGLATEPTYTAKAFAAVRDRVAKGHRVLYIHTYAG